MSLAAGAPAPVLLHSLERAGWGDLAGADLRGVRVTLGALVRLLPHGSGEGHATAEQIAAAAGYSVRWTRRCLHGLEEIGLLRWDRGGIANGKPQPSRFRLDKRTLLALVQIARRTREAALAALRDTTANRIHGLRVLNLRSRTHKRRSVHVELTASLPPYGEVSAPPGSRNVPQPAPTDRHNEHAAAARAAIRAGRKLWRG
jgi:hypothetical protein